MNTTVEQSASLCPLAVRTHDICHTEWRGNETKKNLPKQLQSCSFLLRQPYSTLLVCQKPQMRKTVQRPLCRSNTLFPLRNAAIHCIDETNSIMFRTSHGTKLLWPAERRGFSDSVSEKYVVRHGCLIQVEFRTPVRMRIWCATLSGSCKIKEPFEWDLERSCRPTQNCHFCTWIKHKHRKHQSCAGNVLSRQQTSKNSQHGVTRSKTNDFKSKSACILEASESTRLRMRETLPNHHEDHTAGKGDKSLQNNFVQKFTPMPQAIRIPQQRQQRTRNGRNWKRFRCHT